MFLKAVGNWAVLNHSFLEDFEYIMAVHFLHFSGHLAL